MPNFETFTKRMVPLAKEPYVTIQRRGNLSFNAAAFAALGSPEAVELLYDKDNKIMGVRAVARTVEHAYPVRGMSGRAESTYMVSGRAFTQYYDISTETAIRRPAVMEGGVLCIDLKTPGTEVTSNRRRPAERSGQAELGIEAAGNIALLGRALTDPREID